MIRIGPGRAASLEIVPVRGQDTGAVVELIFNARGQVVQLGLKRRAHDGETGEERAARELAQLVAERLPRTSTLAELQRRAEAVLDFIEQLVALEEMRAAEARRVLAGDAA
jgi:hypothetical protein